MKKHSLDYLVSQTVIADINLQVSSYLDLCHQLSVYLTNPMMIEKMTKMMMMMMMMYNIYRAYNIIRCF